METQKETIDRIERESNNMACEGSGSRMRLIFIPVLVFMRSLFLKGALFRGVAGLKEAVNEWALYFMTESKRYEKSYADDSEMKKRCRNFG
ncbi:hypothetical protein MNBD_NITROSPINAE01-1265 [hydrothermal vent metagenome]|uniref:Uncharacterized protein n=1 Tax=hydrothermal vent metagenome TaxID=652676 RepID=A0A3B1C3D2_9ZZZZ